MNKIFLFALLCISTTYAQLNQTDKAAITTVETIQNVISDKLLAAKDFKLSDGRMVVTEIPCQIINGNTIDKFVVSVVCLQNAFNKIGLERLNDIILFANKKAQATIGTEHNYLPAEIKMAYNPMIKDWSLTNLFSTKDQNGTVNSKLLSMDFDAAGKFIVMKRIF